MKFLIETAPLTGMEDVMAVQAIGQLKDGIFVVEAETQDEATEKLLDLLVKRVGEGQIRRAAVDEAEEFEKRQYEGNEIHESAVRAHEKCAKGGPGSE